MANLEALLNDLANLDAQHDLDGMKSVREAIVAEHADSDEAVEAMYKLGLDFLFRQRDLMAAIESFSAAAKRKHPYWSPAARTSMGLCYYHQKKTQKAMFELRRVAYPEEPTVHSVSALVFLDNIFLEEGNTEEAAKARKARVGQLEKLIKKNKADNADAAERGYHMFQLGLAYRDQGEDKKADVVLKEARDLGPKVLGADLHRSIEELL